jgi:hypothetical protein
MATTNAARKRDGAAAPAADAIAEQVREQAGGLIAGHLPKEVTWRELGCPEIAGQYRLAGEAVRVKLIHILVADNDPAALFTVVTYRPPHGPPEHSLGHRLK